MKLAFIKPHMCGSCGTKVKQKCSWVWLPIDFIPSLPWYQLSLGWKSLFQRFCNVCGGAKNSTQVLPGVIGKKKFKNFPRWDTRARSYSKFQNQGPVLSSQNVQIHRHGKENVILIHRRGVPGKKILFFDPRNSRKTLPCPNISRQMVSREKNMSLCSYQSAFPVSCAQIRWALFFTNPVSIKLHLSPSSSSISMDRL